MKETRFIAQNKEKWQEAENLLTGDFKDPEKLSNLFVQIVDDLSYSRTYYPNRSVRVYLNKIARQYFSIIYGQKKRKHSQFKLFWLNELPQVILFARTELLISLIIFLVSVAIGVFSSIKDPQFVNTILGDSYVTMTEKNIAGGDPMAVYKQTHQVDMFLGITFNNLMVAFRTYVLGIFLCIGTLASLLTNGVMVGCFQYYFLERGLFIESASTIWLHGTLEISSIILAGGAGLTLGRGLIFPGTYSRLQSLQISGTRSLKLMIGITPIFVLAAVIESFVTRYTEAPAILKIILIVLSAAFIIGYFVIYPWLKSRSGFEIPLKETKLVPTNITPANFSQLKNNADVLKDSFQFYGRNGSALFPWIFVASAFVSLFFFFFIKEPSVIHIEDLWWLTLFSEMFFAVNTPEPLFIFTNALGVSIVLYRVMKLIDADATKNKFVLNFKSFIQLFVLAVLLFAIIYLGPWGSALAIGCFGIITFMEFAQLREGSLAKGISRGWKRFGMNKSQGISLQFTLILLSFSFLLILSAPLRYIHTSVIEWNFAASSIWSKKIIHFIEIFIKTSSFYLLLPLIASSFSYLYFSQGEAESATSLKDSIEKMGLRTTKGKR